MLGFRGHVVFADRDMQLDFIELGSFGIALLHSFGFLLFVAVLSVVEDFADRWVCIRCHAEEVEVVAGGQFVGGARAHLAEVFTIWADDHDFRVADVLIDRIESFLGTTMVVWIEVSYVFVPP